MPRLGLRATGRAIGCDHAHLARLVKAGRLARGADGFVDVEEARLVVAQSDPALRRKPAPKSGDKPVTQGSGSPRGHQSDSPPQVTTPDDAREAVRLIEQVLAEEGAPMVGPIDYPAARLAETILKARDKALRIAERRKTLVPLEPFKKHVLSAFTGLRRQIQGMPSRHVPEMAARLGIEPAALQSELDRMIHATLTEMSAPIVRR